MKLLYKILFVLSVAPLWIGCSDDHEDSEVTEDIQLEALQLQVTEKGTDAGVTTRATLTGYSVNRTADPTHSNERLTSQSPWNLDVKIYDKSGTNLYGPANGASWAYNGSEWAPSIQLFLPSYFKPRVDATLFYGANEAAVTVNQSTSDLLLQQDVLVQKSNSYTVTPAHTLGIELIHKHAMLDFVLTNVNADDIKSLTVVANGNTYNPYRVGITTAVEYMVILPEGVKNPQIMIETMGGARYTKTLSINSAQRNHCYCITFTGVELLLSSVTVVNWTYGTALSGQYTTPASYPTFRGTPNLTVNLVYDNGLSQEITFNDRGEATVKPYGRTLIQVNDNVLPTPIILDEMYVDLTNYLSR